MLHNPNWGQPTLDGLISFLKSKPAKSTYVWSDCQNCLIAQYMESIGKRYISKEAGYLGEVIAYMPGWERAIAGIGRRTFGDALKRAKAYQRRLKKDSNYEPAPLLHETLLVTDLESVMRRMHLVGTEVVA